MAIIHQARLHPTKMELLEGWLPQQPWFTAHGAALSKAGAYRFDDPEGEVGIETILVAGEGTVFQVPLTYRGSPLRDGEASLIGTMQHSVLGERWVYDACGDPSYAEALAAAILTGKPQAEQYFDVDGRLEAIPESVVVKSTGPVDASRPAIGAATARGNGAGTLVRAGDLELLVVRRLNLAEQPAGPGALTGNWDGQPIPVTLAAVSGS
jgi:Maltokinase N-terminal cap domain